jgi:hypothetical protein
MRKEAALLSAVAYTFAPRVFGHLAAGHLDIVYALSWWPWLMWAVNKGVSQQTEWVKRALRLGIIAALMFLADVRISLFGFSVAGIYALVLIRRTKNVKSIWMFGFAGLITLVLSIDLIVPLTLWQPYLSRATLTLEDASVLSLRPINLLGMLIPSSPINVEMITYLGVPIFVLSLIGIVSFSHVVRWLWVVALVMIALYSTGPNSFVWPLFARVFPGLLWFRVPSRIWLVITFLAPMLAGYGFQWFLRKIEAELELYPLKWAKLLIVAWMFTVLLIGGFTVIAISQPLSGITLMVTGVSLGSALFLYLSRRISPRLFINLVFAVVVFDLVLTDYQALEWRGTEYWLDPQRPLAERLVELQAKRVYSPTYSLEQQVAAPYDLRLFGGVDPFQLTGIVKAIEEGSGVAVENYQVTIPPLKGIESDADIERANQNAILNTVSLGQWHVSHVVAAYALDHARLQLIEVVNGDYIYANLDYASPDTVATVPDWPVTWPDLPDGRAVTRLNEVTVLTYLVSATGWLVFGAGFLIATRLESNA